MMLPQNSKMDFISSHISGGLRDHSSEKKGNYIAFEKFSNDRRTCSNLSFSIRTCLLYTSDAADE